MNRRLLAGLAGNAPLAALMLVASSGTRADDRKPTAEGSPAPLPAPPAPAPPQPPAAPVEEPPLAEGWGSRAARRRASKAAMKKSGAR